ncbi:MAG: DUF3285 domain-containing protein [Leptolyngbyaceae cyanobacterium SL_7_1]|nr:DUF3285 domain-containing protein [Leptolyngbyaceae cyanobacterium SL_7_1]
MSQSPSSDPLDSSIAPTDTPDPVEQPSAVASSQPSFVKLAMRNMVRKRGTSLFHFALTTVGLLAVLVGLAYITR